MKKKKKNPTVCLRESDIRKLKKEACDSAIKFGITLFLTVMRDKEGYEVEELQRVYKHIQDLVDSINQGYVSFYDLEKVLKEEANIVISLKD